MAFLGDVAAVITLIYDPPAPPTKAALWPAAHKIAAQVELFGPLGSDRVILGVLGYHEARIGILD